jgi:putative protease
MSGTQIGQITHYFDHISVAALTLTETLHVGETIHILGHSTDFKQEVTSLQIEHQSVNEAKAGDDVAIKVTQKVHPHDKVFKITGE